MSFLPPNINYYEHFLLIRKDIKLIYIEGNIGSGKSTIIDKEISKYLDKEYLNYSIYKIKEPLDEWEGKIDGREINMLEEMYIDDKKIAMFQNYVLNTHFQNMVKQIYENSADIYIVERSIYSCKYVFSEMLYDKYLISDYEKIVIEAQFNIFNNEKSLPDYIFHILTSPENCYDRIVKRNRLGEENISLDYLLSIRKYEKKMIHYLSKKVLVKIIYNDLKRDYTLFVPNLTTETNFE